MQVRVLPGQLIFELKTTGPRIVGHTVRNMKLHYQKDNLAVVVAASKTYRETLETLGLRAAGGNYGLLKKYISDYSLDVSHFESNAVKTGKLAQFQQDNLTSLEDILVANSTFSRGWMKTRLYRAGLKKRQCELCDQGETWQGKQMALILDHKNGVHNDNRLENLQIVCANCNATLDTHCGKQARNKNRLNKCKVAKEASRLKAIDSNMKRRKVVRPDLGVVRAEIAANGYSATGRKYGVSDNAIRKWLK